MGTSQRVWAVFATDAWHTHASLEFLGVAANIHSAIDCINAEQKNRGAKSISKEQVELIYRIRQTQSDDHIDGEYLIQATRIWSSTPNLENVRLSRS